MADKITSKDQLKILVGFTDEDDRTLTVDDPKQGLTWENIETFASAASNVLIGDKFSAQFSRVKEAKYVTTKITEVETN